MKRAASIFASVLLLAGAASAFGLNGSISTGGGYDTNPTGYYNTDAQAFGWSTVDLKWKKAVDDGLVTLSYTGNGYSFAPQSAWSAHKHALAAEFANTLNNGTRLSFGAEAGGSWNHPDYSAYTFREATGFATANRTVSDTRFDAMYQYSVRSYGESPEFSYGQHELSGAVRHTWPTRTTVRGQVSFAGRSYTNQSYEDYYDGVSNATSRRLRVDGYVSQGLTASTGLRLSGYAQDGTGRSRWRNDYWVVMDDPLASSGFGGTAQLSWLAPGGLTLRTRVGGDRLTEAYVDANAEYASRVDESVTGGVSLEGALPWAFGGRSPMWTAGLSLTKQDSDDPSYTYTRSALTLGLRYAW